MEEEILNSESGNEQSEGTIDYIEALKEMKQNTVPKSEYAKLKEENAKLLRNIINGEELPDDMKQHAETPKADIDALRKELYSGKNEMTNLEYISKTMELRDALIESGEPDPFVPSGHKLMPTREDVERAQAVADIYRECIDYANGDSEIFTQELMRRTVDAAPIAGRRIQNRR